MQFAIKDLKNFLHSTTNNNIQQITIKSNNLEICINKQKELNQKIFINSINSFQTQKHSTSNIQKNKQNSKTNHNNIVQHISSNESEIYSTIISPMVGTFYRSPAPNEPAFIKKNENVQKKQIVCIIEAMKLMNEIEAEVNGEIVEILVNDGDIVDCGQALMKVKLT
uniref:Biotin carboxyl carrier protein of acetyl-CoA carboxylase n=1 Tax=Antithamnionella ternifolia TaxID=207919 RepID=A0A4D6WJF2_9FLOR|nr:acetyl-CoA carboxylase, biotin carboxyl carrier protein [Antithamnionella ternifolia]